MLNNTGIKKETLVSVNQILADTTNYFATGCVVANTGVDAGADGKKIIKAGTPVKGDSMNPTTAYTVATADATGVLVHDVDVTNGNANASVLLFGFVDVNNVDASVKALYTSKVVSALNKITFVG